MNKIRPPVSLLLKALVSFGILGFLLSRVDLGHLLRALSSASPLALGVALGGYLAGQLVSSYRWALLARPLGFGNSLQEFTCFYFIGMFFNLFAPSTVGGDIGRVFYLARGRTRDESRDWAGPTTYALISVVADRAVGMTALVWTGAVALALFRRYRVPGIIEWMTYGLGVGLVVGLVFLPVMERALKLWGHPIVAKLRLAVGTYRGRSEVLTQTLGLSLIVHFIQASAHLYIGRALGIDIPWSYCFILYPLVGLFSSLPITLNGFGLREGGYLFLLGLIGVSSEKAIAFSFLWFIVVALDSLLGGALFILKRAPAPGSLSAEPGDQLR
jgi:glycosyltransferase 2 family protein